MGDFRDFPGAMDVGYDGSPNELFGDGMSTLAGLSFGKYSPCAHNGLGHCPDNLAQAGNCRLGAQHHLDYRQTTCDQGFGDIDRCLFVCRNYQWNHRCLLQPAN